MINSDPVLVFLIIMFFLGSYFWGLTMIRVVDMIPPVFTGNYPSREDIKKLLFGIAYGVGAYIICFLGFM